MQSKKAQKIDLNAEYPCPCRRRGRLVPITLTEAFGCDRCQHIFVVEESGYSIEQLPTNYPYKRSWRWNGHAWSMAHPGFKESYLPIALFIILVPPFIWLISTLRSPSGQNIIGWAILIVLVAVLPAFMVWLAYRR